VFDFEEILRCHRFTIAYFGLNIVMAQMAPVWLDKQKTLQKVERCIIDASKNKAELLFLLRV